MRGRRSSCENSFCKIYPFYKENLVETGSARFSFVFSTASSLSPDNFSIIMNVTGNVIENRRMVNEKYE